MKISVIAWHIFWAAVHKQRLASLDGWLRRWVFADDGVRLSMKPRSDREDGSGLTVRENATSPFRSLISVKERNGATLYDD